MTADPQIANQPGTASRRADKATFLAVLVRPAFAFLVIGQTVSQLGDKLHHMALINLVGSEATGTGGTSGLALAQLAVVFTVPMILFGPLAGALVDRWNKRTTMIVCDALRALLVLLIPVSYAWLNHIWPVYVLSFFVFALGLFFNAAKMAMIPDLVGEQQLLAANAVSAFIGRFATVFGIVGGGVIVGWQIWGWVGWSGYEAGFYLDAMSYFISVVTLLFVIRYLRGTPDHHSAGARPTTEVARQSLTTLLRDVRGAVGVVRGHETLRFVFLSVILVATLAASVYVVITVSIQTVLGRGTQGVGYFGGILGAGMIVGSLLVGTVGSRWNKRQTILLGCALIGLLMMLGGVFFSFAAFAPVAFGGGMVLAPIMVSQDTLIHEAAPQRSRALIFSTRDLVMGAAFMVASLIAGGSIALMSRFGVDEAYRVALFVLGAIILVAALAGEGTLLRRRAAR